MRAAHKLKASLGSFGAQRAYQAALQLEELGGATDVTGCQHAFPELEEAVKRLQEGLADLLSTAELFGRAYHNAPVTIL